MKQAQLIEQVKDIVGNRDQVNKSFFFDFDELKSLILFLGGKIGSINSSGSSG
jgi:hypothetical protein